MFRFLFAVKLDGSREVPLLCGCRSLASRVLVVMRCVLSVAVYLPPSAYFYQNKQRDYWCNLMKKSRDEEQAQQAILKHSGSCHTHAQTEAPEQTPYLECHVDPLRRAEGNWFLEEKQINFGEERR